MNYTNPLQNKYKFLLDAYTGEGGFADGSYLVPHPRETDEKYNRRKLINFYPNYVKKIVKAYIGHLFKNGIHREFKDDVYKNFCQDVDKRGTHIDFFIKKAFRLSMVLGVSFIIVDKPEEKALTKAELIEKRLYPYAVIRTPDAVVDYKINNDGELVKIVFSEQDDDGNVVYRIFEKNGWRISKDKEENNFIKQGEYNLGEIPVVMLYASEPVKVDEITPTPWIWDIARANWDIYNAISELRELFRGQIFSILAVPIRDPKEAENLKNMTISVENALPYNPEAGGKPDFISPPEGPAKLYMEYLKEGLEHIYRLAGLEFTGGVAGSNVAKSGVALAFMFQEMNSSLLEMSLLCEKAEKDILRIVCKWEGIKPESNISYPRKFNIVDLAEELKNNLDALTAGISETFDKEIKKKISHLMLSGWTDDEVLKKIDDEIDAEGDVYERRIREEIEG